MTGYDYLIVGGGMSADAAVGGIRSIDRTGTIGLVTSDAHPPYKRPPLSKGLWKGDPIEKIWMGRAEKEATIHSPRVVTEIRTGERQVLDDRGGVYSYGKLLLATGGRVRKFPFQTRGIIYFRTLDDYTALRERTRLSDSSLVVGGGFIGSEIAASLAMSGQKVTMILRDQGIGARIYPRELSEYLNDYYRSKGVEIVSNDEVTSIVSDGDGYLVRTSSGKELRPGTVVAGLGILPNIELASAAGLETGDGILVDDRLQTSQSGVFAAGDVANFPHAVLGVRTRVEHEDNALAMGECAGKNMAGANETYRHQPYFYSDLFDLGYEAVGVLDSRLEVVADWKEDFREGVLYYFEGDRLRGVLLWNTWGQVENARRLLAGWADVARETVKGRLPVSAEEATV